MDPTQTTDASVASTTPTTTTALQDVPTTVTSTSLNSSPTSTESTPVTASSNSGNDTVVVGNITSSNGTAQVKANDTSLCITANFGPGNSFGKLLSEYNLGLGAMSKDVTCTITNTSLVYDSRVVIKEVATNGGRWNFSGECTYPGSANKDAASKNDSGILGNLGDLNVYNTTRVASTLSEFGVALGINSATFVGLLTLFVILRKIFKKVYSPRTEIPTPGIHLPAIPNGTFAWILPVIRVDEMTFLRYCGLDATMMMRLMGLGAKFFAIATIYGVGVLLPVNYHGGGGLGDFGSMSLSNISANRTIVSPYWAHLAGAYFFSITLMYMLNREYKRYLQMRVHYLKEQAPGYSVFVWNLSDRDNSDDALFKLFNFIFPGKVLAAVTHKDTRRLDRLLGEQASVLQSLELAVVKYAKDGARPMHKLGFMGCFGEQVDSLRYYAHKLQAVNMAVAEEQRAPHGSLNCGFVTFNSLTTAACAAQAQLSLDPSIYRTEAAPEPRDVHWPSLDISRRQKTFRRFWTELIVVIMCFTWSVPASLIQALTSPQALTKAFPSLSGLFDSWFFSAVVVGYLPTILLSILLTLVPIICYALSSLEGHSRISYLEFSALSKVYLFLIVTVLFVSTISGSLLKVVDTFTLIIQQPMVFLEMLGESLAAQGTFYINFVMLRGLSGFSLRMVNFGQLFYVLLFRIFASTERQKTAAYYPPPPYYHWDVADALLVFAIGLTYACIAPFILPLCVLYFVLGYFVYKYFFLYVQVPYYESGGQLWQKMFSRVIVGLVISECTLLGFFIINLSPLMAFMVPLIVGTVFFYQVEKDRYSKAEVPLLVAMDVDEDRNTLDGEGGLNFLDRKAYIKPSLLKKFPTPEVLENGGDEDLAKSIDQGPRFQPPSPSISSAVFRPGNSVAPEPHNPTPQIRVSVSPPSHDDLDTKLQKV